MVQTQWVVTVAGWKEVMFVESNENVLWEPEMFSIAEKNRKTS